MWPKWRRRRCEDQPTGAQGVHKRSKRCATHHQLVLYHEGDEEDTAVAGGGHEALGGEGGWWWRGTVA